MFRTKKEIEEIREIKSNQITLFEAQKKIKEQIQSIQNDLFVLQRIVSNIRSKER